MEHIDVVAGAPHLHPTPRFNISLNLSSVWAALFPGTRMLARLRGVHEAAIESEMPTVVAVEELWNESIASASTVPVPAPVVDEVAAFPGAWGFVTSWYMIGLFIMAVFLHRIQNIVVPSRQPSRRQRHAFRFGPSYAPSRSLFRHLYGALLPLDFSRTTTRLALHLPSMYLLGRMLLVWFFLIIQTSDIRIPPFMSGLMQWTVQQDMRDICWSTFSAVCVAFLVEGFVKALDGIGTGFPIGNNPNTSPFNLVGYAFLLHVYSSPITHTFTPAKSPSRPDKHVIITFAIPLLQLTVFHLLSISKRLSTHRLIPTAITSFLSLLHFHGTLYSHFRKAKLAAAMIPTATSETTTSATSRPPLPTHVSYPLLNYIPNMFETFLISTILLTVLLNAVVQLLVRGRIERLFSGLGIGTGSAIADDDDGNPPGFLRSLPLEEDFGVLLLRVGIASLEATGLRGWGNEVAPITLPLRSHGRAQGPSGRFRNQLTNNTTTTPIRTAAVSEFGTVRMGRTSVGGVQSGYGTAPAALGGTASALRSRTSAIDDVFSDSTSSRRRRRALPAPNTTTTLQRSRQGFANEVRTVDLGVPSVTDAVELQDTTGGYLGGAYIRRYFWALVQWCGTVWGVAKGLVRMLLDRAMGRERVVPPRADLERIKPGRALRVQKTREMSAVSDQETEEERREIRDRELYERFVRDEEITDDEDDDGVDSGGAVHGPAWNSSDEGEESDEFDDGYDEDGDEDGAAGREQEAVRLFTDILRNGTFSTRDPSMSPEITRGDVSMSESASGEMVLAHLMHGATSQTSPGPLTRRRWNALFRRGTLEAEDEDVFFEDEVYGGEVAPRASGAMKAVISFAGLVAASQCVMDVERH
ncbi:hypothetical protein D9619_005258 [Psilocybe cf. subviscida]|uniref:Uncharacterized protein n=1 Tax=Psilocybe cf. subviscida TaxID=2480587 RepID=A0A8H5BY93_9AGAR|nr:hypothetical protein D9619_005258 [Psilocybe cf. subviscida]